jgi:hypothetical protein
MVSSPTGTLADAEDDVDDEEELAGLSCFCRAGKY